MARFGLVAVLFLLLAGCTSPPAAPLPDRGEPGKQSLGAEAQQGLRDACDRIAAVEAGDGAKATQLWNSLRTGTTSDVEELVAVWVRLTDAYTDVYHDIPIELSEIREFRTAVFVVGGSKDIAADFLKTDGVAKVEAYFSQNDVRKAEQTVRSFCA